MGKLENISIKGEDRSPTIDFNAEKGMLLISGRMVPVYAIEHKFFHPILEWVKKYSEKPAERTVLKLNIDFFSTTASKGLYKILKIFGNMYNTGKDVSVIWIYDKEDENSKEQGTQFSELLQMPFTYIPR